MFWLDLWRRGLQDRSVSESWAFWAKRRSNRRHTWLCRRYVDGLWRRRVKSPHSRHRSKITHNMAPRAQPWVILAVLCCGPFFIQAFLPTLLARQNEFRLFNVQYYGLIKMTHRAPIMTDVAREGFRRRGSGVEVDRRWRTLGPIPVYKNLGRLSSLLANILSDLLRHFQPPRIYSFDSNPNWKVWSSD